MNSGYFFDNDYRIRTTAHKPLASWLTKSFFQCRMNSGFKRKP